MPKMPSCVPTHGMVEVLTLEFCCRCQRQTLRLVYPDGHQGPCMGCNPDCMTKAQQHDRERRIREQQNPSLF